MSKFLIYKSSAGSGKTYTLVKEYLKLALSAPGEYRHILAVTFTNKSAEEMKSRIINSLIELSKGGAEELKKQLETDGVKGNISLMAGGVLKNILHKYSDFSVLTIDSFFHRIIRSFAKELNLQLGYNIEIDDKIVMERITEELLDAIGSDPDLTKYIEEYVYFRIDDNKGWKIDTNIKDLAGEIFKERYWIKKGSESGLADNREKMHGFIQTLFAIIDNFERTLTSIAKDSYEVISEIGLGTADFKNGTFSYFSKIINKEKYSGDIAPGKIVRKIIEGQDTWYTQKSFKKAQIKEAAEKGLNKNLAEAIMFYDNSYKQYNSAKELIKTVYVLGIYKDLMERLKQYRDDNKIMLISDTNTILMKVISGESSPFIYEKTGNVYKNFLIDEFQDTSTFQWKNFLPLIQNSLSENNFSMIVGDVKQSIYRWRNGNMKLLLEDAAKDLNEFNEITKQIPLDENYRSRKEIINFNNIFFKEASQKLAEKAGETEGKLLLNSYSGVEQKDTYGESGGYVNISIVQNGEEDDPFELVMEKTKNLITDALNSGYAKKDIMILTRSNRQASETAHYLIDAGFKVISNESLLLTNSPKVRLLLNLLKYISDNKNYLAKTEILFNYLVYIKKENIDPAEIFNDYKNHDDPLFNTALPEEFFSKDTQGRLNPAFFRLNLYELVEMLIRIFGLNNTMDAYLLRFLDVIVEFSALNTGDLTGFFEWWEQNKDDNSIVIPEQEDAVRIMTIHMAKGLQSPVVIIPYANWEMGFSGRDLIWVSSKEYPFNESAAFPVTPGKNLMQSCFEEDYIEEHSLTYLDNFNLLYVAFTRAEERLHVIASPKAIARYNVGILINATLASSLELNSGFINDSDFEIGIKADKQGTKPEEVSYKAGEILSTDYFTKIVIKPASADVSIERVKKFSELKNRGILLHKALSLIKYPGDAEKAFEQLKTEGLVTAENEDDFINELLDILKNEKIKHWFSSDYEIKTETEVVLPGGKVYKPDRVLLKDKKAVVIDYKTGKHKKDHALQVSQYADILKDMGFMEVEKYLFYVAEREVVSV